MSFGLPLVPGGGPSTKKTTVTSATGERMYEHGQLEELYGVRCRGTLMGGGWIARELLD